MNISIIGLGLIGGSIARDLKSQIYVQVSGVDSNDNHCQMALDLGVVDQIISLEEAMDSSDVIIIAVPVDALQQLLPTILNQINDHQVLIDVGSTKKLICDAVRGHDKRGRFIAAHPLAGTEFSGPGAALKGLFVEKKNIVCESDLVQSDSLGMQTIFMDPSEHDKHLAYVSHLSHVSSFMLGMTVLDIERDEKQIFNLAGTGFASTVRLAKSNPKTWSAIFEKNNVHLSAALDQYILWLQKFKKAMDEGDRIAMESYMTSANDIKRVLNK